MSVLFLQNKIRQHLDTISCTSFILNEDIYYYKKVINLDLNKAFEKMYRNCLFSKLIDELKWKAIDSHIQKMLF